MAEGNQSDLVVSISVDTTQVRSGFEQVVSMSEKYAKQVAEIWTKGFATLVSQNAISHAMESAKKGAVASLKPLVMSASWVAKAVAPVFPAINPGPGRISSQGQMVGAEERIKALAQAHAEAKRILGAATAEQRRQVEEEREQARKKRAEERLANEQALSEMRAKVREDERLKKIEERRVERHEKQSEADARAEAKKKEREEQRKLNDLKRQERKHDQDILQAYAKALIVLRYLRRALRAIVNLSKEWIETANNIYQSQFKLAAALRVHNQLTDGQVRYLYQQVDALSQIYGLSREVNYSAAQILSSYIGAADGLTDMLGAIDQLTLKMYGYGASAENAASIARIMGRALSGNLQTLKRYGIELTAAEEATLKSGTASRADKVKALMEAISRYTGDLSNAVNTWAGQTNLTKVYVESIKNELGLALQNFLLPIVKCVNVVLKGVAEIAKWVRYISVIAFGNSIKGAEEMAGAAEAADDAYADLEKRLLGFDKFNVLSGGDSADSLSGIGSALDIPELESNVPEWVDELSKIPPVADAIKVALIAIAAALASIVGSMAIMGLKGVIGTIKGIATSLGVLNTGLGVTKAQIGMVAAAIALLVVGIYEMVKGIQDLGNWSEMTDQERAMAVLRVFLGLLMSIGGVLLVVRSGILKNVAALLSHATASITAALSSEAFAAALQSVALSVAAISVAAAGLAIFVMNIEKMGGLRAVAVGFAAALIAVAAGVIAIVVAGKGMLAAVQAAMIAGGLALAIGSLIATAGQAGIKTSDVPTLANGGIPDKGQLFIANENGPELVGNIGGRTSVANNAMITKAIEEAAYRGFSKANSEVGAGGVSITLQGDAVRNDALVRALMPALKTEIKRQGGLKKALGGD